MNQDAHYLYRISFKVILDRICKRRRIAMMKKYISIFLLFIAQFLYLSAQNQYDTAKPWTWWWILGNSMTKSDISAQLEYMQKAGVGGVCVIPLYGEKGDESNYIDLISPKFMDMLSHISKEAKRLGLGVDMTMGSGWPFGGPWIPPQLASKKIDENLKCANLNFMVKRSSPGGHGHTADPFNPAAYKLHAQQFEKAFAPYKDEKLLRGFFNDSYEYYAANFTDNFYEEFKKRRGYDFQPYAREIFSQTKSWEKNKIKNTSPSKISPEDSERIWQDYHQTLSDLLYETMTEFASASSKMGFLSVNQAHGSPGNLIDLYALADIPETESFGASIFDIPLVRQDPDYEEERFGRPNKLMMKFASSAANLYDKDLVASESCTWLANHFKVALSQVKPELDKLFVSGINHIFYHGTPYSPMDKPFPGRLFYASTNFNYNSHFKEFFPELNEYVRRIQSVMQNSKSDNDILLYFPIHAFWRGSGGPYHVLCFEVHNAMKWLKKVPKFDELINNLDKLGFCFDYVSDMALNNLEVVNGVIKSNGKYYKALVVPECEQLPLETFKNLDRLVRDGAKIVFQNKIPEDVPGFGNLAERRQAARDIKNSWINIHDGFFVGNVPAIVSSLGAKRETIADFKLDFIRKFNSQATIYFICNQNSAFEMGNVEISEPCEQIEYFNPLTGERAKLKSEKSASGTKFQLRLLPGESCLIFANKTINPDLPLKTFTEDGDSKKIDTEWTIDFLRALPTPVPASDMPAQIKTRRLRSWTEIGDDNAKKFCGVARYSANFKVDDPSEKYVIDLGNIRDAARVKINGTNIGSVWCVPFRLEIPDGVLKDSNTIEIEVTNNSFNRAKSVAEKNPDWNKGNNIIDITYTPYDIRKEPLEDAGLLEEIRLIKQLTPKN